MTDKKHWINIEPVQVNKTDYHVGFYQCFRSGSGIGGQKWPTKKMHVFLFSFGAWRHLLGIHQKDWIRIQIQWIWMRNTDFQQIVYSMLYTKPAWHFQLAKNTGRFEEGFKIILASKYGTSFPIITLFCHISFIWVFQRKNHQCIFFKKGKILSFSSLEWISPKSENKDFSKMWTSVKELWRFLALFYFCCKFFV
jgi:hypothetical protein